MRAVNASQACALAIVDELARQGVTHACISPGSRSAPLALAFAAEDRIRLHVILDERSAAFAALGIAKESGRPAVVLTTSGTAAANVHPAILEAHHSRTPIVVLTADRPPELRDAGAPQTIDQLGLFGEAVRWFAEVGVPEVRAGSVAYWRSLAARAAITSCSTPPGPVHLNLAFREPLVPVEDDEGWPHDLGGRPDGAPWITAWPSTPVPDPTEVGRLADRVSSTERGAIVAGAGDVDPEPVLELARALGWPVLAEPTSGLRRGDNAVSAYDALLRNETFAAKHEAELVLRLGALGTSKPLVAWTARADQVLIDPNGGWLDSTRSAALLVRSDPARLCVELMARVGARGRSGWLESWRQHESRALEAIDGTLDASEAASEPATARDLATALPDGATLVVGASMPVRDLDWFMRPRSGLRVLANRGVNGIDGFVSTAIGAALAGHGPVVALCGDLTLLHDQNGLLLMRSEAVNVVFVVANNDGGGVFSFLPQVRWPEHFERLFATPQGISFAALADLHGLEHTRVDRRDELGPSLTAAIAAGGAHLLEVPTNRSLNAGLHQRVWDAVGRTFDPGT